MDRQQKIAILTAMDDAILDQALASAGIPVDGWSGEPEDMANAGLESWTQKQVSVSKESKGPLVDTSKIFIPKPKQDMSYQGLQMVSPYASDDEALAMGVL